MILSIDPGNIETGYVVIDVNNGDRPVEHAKVDNEWLNENLLKIINFHGVTHVAIEMIASYGMAVGESVFQTCVWIGRFYETISRHCSIEEIKYIYRKEEKINICGTMKAKDSNIRTALIDRYAQHDFKNGKGTKRNPDFFYGFAKDQWAAMAVGITYKDLYYKK